LWINVSPPLGLPGEAKRRCLGHGAISGDNDRAGLTTQLGFNLTVTLYTLVGFNLGIELQRLTNVVLMMP
jgi:hypothetical protein